MLGLVLLPMGMVALMRVFAWDRLEPFAVADTYSLYVYVPAWGIAGIAFVGRRLVLAVSALVLVAAQLLFVMPEVLASAPVPSWADRTAHFRIFDANIWNENPDVSGYAADVKALRAQIVTLEEITPPQLSAFHREGAFDGYRFAIALPRYGSRGFLVESTFPLHAIHEVSVLGQPLMVQAEVQAPSGNFELWVVHTQPPYPVWFQVWRRGLALVASDIRHRGPQRLLVVGDFNADWGSQGFHAVLDAGMTDAAAARGNPLEMTWSQTMPILPPLIRIDHVLSGPEIAVTAVRTLAGPGSDHRALLATFAVERRAR